MAKDQPFPQVITVDCWDTLLRRICAPEAVKMESCRNVLICLAGHGLNVPQENIYRARLSHERDLRAESVARGGDPEFRLADVLLRLLWGFIPGVDSIPGYVTALARAEEEIEIAVSRPDAAAHALLQAHPAARKIVVSDYYMPAASLSRILAAKGWHFQPGDILVSCDSYAVKATGRLLAEAALHAGVGPGDILHIGDSMSRDVRPARRMGMKAHHHQITCQDNERRAAEATFRARLQGAAPILTMPPPSDGITPMEAAGRAAAPLFAAFSLFILGQARARKAGRIGFFTREGVFLEKVFRASMSGLDPRISTPETFTAEVSRTATFLPSLPAPDFGSVATYWRQASPLSVAGLCTALGIPRETYEAAGLRAHLDVDGVIPDFFHDGGAAALFDDPDFAGVFRSTWEKSRIAAAQYLSGVRLGDPGTMVVDIGWRGSIQDAVSRITGGAGQNGVYLGLLPPAATPQEGSAKTGFLFDRAAGLPEGKFDLTQSLRIFEMLTNAPAASLLRYALPGENSGGFIRKPDVRGAAHHATWVAPFQAAVLRYAAYAAYELHSAGSTDRELRAVALRAALGIARKPSQAVARSYFAYSHDETFDRGGWFEPGPVAAVDLALAPFSGRARRHAADAMRASGWHVGALRLCAGGLPLALASAVGVLDDGPVRRLAGRLMSEN